MWIGGLDVDRSLQLLSLKRPCAEKELLIAQYRFNNSVNATPTDREPPRPQDMGNIIVRNQLMNENLAGNRVIRIS